MYRKILIPLLLILCSISQVNSITSERLEQTGIEANNITENLIKPVNPRPSVNRFGGVLMIPVGGDSLGLFDPNNGNYLGSLCYIGANTPINAVQGPDNKIYISYQVGDKVDVFDTTGAFLYSYATSSNGLDNTRGIAFRDGHLFITNGSPALKTIEMSAPNTVVRTFIQDGSDPFDIYFLPNGKSLLADIAGTTDNVRIYDTNGVYIRNIFSINFPEQIQEDQAFPGRFLVAGFSTNNIQNFDTNGTIYRTWPLSGARGVYRLGNGNILGTNGTAVYSIDSGTGTATIKRSGQGRFIELYQEPTMLIDTISASAIGPGTIIPSGIVLVRRGSDTTLTITPNTNCQLDSLIVDNVNHGDDSTYYRFTNVTSNHTITAYFSYMVSFQEIQKGNFAFGIRNIYPNPFKNRIVIQYQLTNPTDVDIKIYNCLGAEVRTLVSKYQNEGSFQVTWDGSDNTGVTVTRGVYFCSIKTNNQIEQRRLILIK